MGSVLTTWALKHPGESPSRCIVQQSEDGHGYDVIVWTGASIVLWERVASAEAARDRADEFWTVLVAHGREPFAPAAAPPLQVVRQCPECASPAARITHQRNRFAVLSCGACGFRWNDRLRMTTADRRGRPRPEVDRRRAA